MPVKMSGFINYYYICTVDRLIIEIVKKKSTIKNEMVK